NKQAFAEFNSCMTELDPTTIPAMPARRVTRTVTAPPKFEDQVFAAPTDLSMPSTQISAPIETVSILWDNPVHPAMAPTTEEAAPIKTAAIMWDNPPVIEKYEMDDEEKDMAGQSAFSVRSLAETETAAGAQGATGASPAPSLLKDRLAEARAEAGDPSVQPPPAPKQKPLFALPSFLMKDQAETEQTAPAQETPAETKQAEEIQAPPPAVEMNEPADEFQPISDTAQSSSPEENLFPASPSPVATTLVKQAPAAIQEQPKEEPPSIAFDAPAMAPETVPVPRADSVVSSKRSLSAPEPAINNYLFDNDTYAGIARAPIVTPSVSAPVAPSSPTRADEMDSYSTEMPKVDKTDVLDAEILSPKASKPAAKSIPVAKPAAPVAPPVMAPVIAAPAMPEPIVTVPEAAEPVAAPVIRSAPPILPKPKLDPVPAPRLLPPVPVEPAALPPSISPEEMPEIKKATTVRAPVRNISGKETGFRPAPVVPSGSWSSRILDATSQNGKDAFCLLENQFKNGSRLMIAQRADGFSTVGINYGVDMLQMNRNYNVTIQVDNEFDEDFTGYAETPHTLIVQMGKKRSFFDTLGAARAMRVAMSGVASSFKIDTIGTALNKFSACLAILGRPAVGAQESIIPQAETSTFQGNSNE
ncbi:MAG: hypothetical protein JWM96_967, partial [Alphaproteobacteria bacterium]|nr:hypothetical protein [Alphaproteobacteria bacterium]